MEQLRKLRDLVPLRSRVGVPDYCKQNSPGLVEDCSPSALFDNDKIRAFLLTGVELQYGKENIIHLTEE